MFEIQDDNLNREVVNSRCRSFELVLVYTLTIITHQLIQYYLIIITYYSSTPSVLFYHPYYLLRFISVCFYLFVLILITYFILDG